MTSSRKFSSMLLSTAAMTMALAVLPNPADATEVSAATLDKIMSRLDRLEAENAALKKEVAAARAGQQPVVVAKHAPAAGRKLPREDGVRKVEAPVTTQAITQVAPVRDEYAQSPRFSGIYVGINGGYGRGAVSTGRTDYTHNSVNGDIFGYGYTAGQFFAEGPVVGGQIGYNYQFANNIMLGVETDLDWADVIDAAGNSGSGWSNWVNNYVAGQQSFNRYVRVGIDWIGTARVRLGYSFGPFIPYITAGLAYGQLSSVGKDIMQINAENLYSPDSYLVGGTGGSNTLMKAGWAIGAGAEYMLVGPWSAKGEYLYTSLGGINRTDQTYSVGNFINKPNGISQVSTGTFGIHQVRVGLNYHLDFERNLPVVAKY